MKELNCDTTSAIMYFLSEFFGSFVIIMIFGLPFTIPIGIIEIFGFSGIVSLFFPHLQSLVYGSFRDVVSFALDFPLSTISENQLLLLVFFAMVFGSVTIAVLLTWEQLNDSEIWWNGLSEEEKEEIQMYWMSLDFHKQEQQRGV